MSQSDQDFPNLDDPAGGRGYEGFDGYGQGHRPQQPAPQDPAPAEPAPAQQPPKAPHPQVASSAAFHVPDHLFASEDAQPAPAPQPAPEPAPKAAENPESKQPKEPTDSTDTKDSSGVPIRGIAMVVLTLGVLLIAFGVYRLVNNSGDDTPTPSTSTVAAPTSTRAARPTTTPSLAPSTQPAPTTDVAPSTQAAPTTQPAQPAATVDKSATTVTVLNNSNVSGLADRIATRLKGNDWSQTNYGNLPTVGDGYPRSVVLYTEGDAAGKAAAEQIATELGITAAPRTAQQNSELTYARLSQGGSVGSVVVVVTSQLS